MVIKSARYIVLVIHHVDHVPKFFLVQTQTKVS
jgi:hypothetical protein